MAQRKLVIAGRALALAALFLTRRLRWLFVHNFLWLYPSLRRNCGWHGEVVTSFETPRREVWLTIDDGPSHDTEEMLDILAQHGARATFFVVGNRVSERRSVCRRIVKEGHGIGNHTGSHPSGAWWITPSRLVRREIERCSHAIRTATGTRPRFFRSPVGMNNSSVHPAAEAEGMRVVGWSASGLDGCPSAPSQVIDRIMADVFPGAIILLHERGRSRRRAATLFRLLDRLEEEGYRCILPEEDALR